MTDLVVIGDVNPDVVVAGVPADLAFGQAERLVDGIDLLVGGSASITAHGAARLAADVSLVGVVGADPLGGWLCEQLSSAGVDVSRVRVDDAAPTGASVVLDRGGDRAILTRLGAIGSLSAGDLEDLPDLPARHVHVASYFLLPPAAREALPSQLARWRTAGATCSVDTNYDPAGRWDVGGLLNSVDLCLPNETEAAALDWTGYAGERVTKRGAAGADWEGGGDRVRVAAPTADDYVDSTGAGDSFDAAYLVARLEGRTPAEALTWAVAAGTLSTRGRGGTAGQPTRAELVELAARLEPRAG